MQCPRYSSSSESDLLAPPPPPDSDEDESSSASGSISKGSEHSGSPAYPHESIGGSWRIDFPNEEYQSRSFVSSSSSKPKVSARSGAPCEHSVQSLTSKRCSDKHIRGTSTSFASDGETPPHPKYIDHKTTSESYEDGQLIDDLFDLLQSQTPSKRSAVAPDGALLESLQSSSAHSSPESYRQTRLLLDPPTDDSSDESDAGKIDPWSIRAKLQPSIDIVRIFTLRCAFDHLKCVYVHERQLDTLKWYVKSLNMIARVTTKAGLRRALLTMASYCFTHLLSRSQVHISHFLFPRNGRHSREHARVMLFDF